MGLTVLGIVSTTRNNPIVLPTKLLREGTRCHYLVAVILIIVNWRMFNFVFPNASTQSQSGDLRNSKDFGEKNYYGIFSCKKVSVNHCIQNKCIWFRLLFFKNVSFLISAFLHLGMFSNSHVKVS